MTFPEFRLYILNSPQLTSDIDANIFWTLSICPKIMKCASIIADPHFVSFNGLPWSWHGGCDVVLSRSDDLGIEVVIRTTRVEDEKIGAFSFISGVAAKLGTDILEVTDDGSIIINGEDKILVANTNSTSPGISFSTFQLAKSLKGTNNRIIVYDLDLGEGRAIEIRANTKSGMLFVDMKGNYPHGEGLLGSTGSNALFGRDGITDFSVTNDFNSFAEDWQRLGTEEKLFQDDRYPQHPAGCVYDAGLMNGNKRVSQLRHRRLTDDGDIVSINDAENACSHVADVKKRKFCVADVLVLADVDLAEDPFYH